MPPKVAKPGPQAVEAAPAAPVPSVDLSLTLRTHPSAAAAAAAAAEPSGAAEEDALRNHLETNLAPYTSIHARIVSDWLEGCVGTNVSNKFEAIYYHDVDILYYFLSPKAIGAEGSEWIERSNDNPSSSGSQESFYARPIGKTFQFSKTLAAKLPNFASEAEALAFVPRIYILVMGCDGPERIVPLEVLVLDCSPMALGGAAVVHTSVVSRATRFSIECSATNNIPLLNQDIVKKNNQLRVLDLNIKRWANITNALRTN
jgi:hypothetical protein